MTVDKTALEELAYILGESIHVPMKNTVKETAYLNILSIINMGLMDKDKRQREQQVQKAVLEALEKEVIPLSVIINRYKWNPVCKDDDEVMLERAKDYFETQVKPRYTK